MEGIDRLPTDVHQIIYEFVTIEAKVYLTKNNFVKYYALVWENEYKDSRRDMQSRITDIVRKGRQLPFELLLDKYFNKWSGSQAKLWRWNSKLTGRKLTFPNYLTFITYLCIRYKRQKLRALLAKKIMQNSKSSQKNRHKKIRTRNISWSN